MPRKRKIPPRRIRLRADPPPSARRQPDAPRGRWRWTRLAVFASAGVVLLGAVLLLAARPLLTLAAPPGPADAILVLGGETPRRSAKAADLFHAGLAPRIYVSGGGDAPIIRRYLVKEGVPAERIVIEDRSATTWENALFVTPLMRHHGVRRVLLVTSWFHTRRAVATFRRAAGDLRYRPVPAEYSWAAYRSPWLEEKKFVCREYAKIVAYLFRHGVSPFARAED